MRDYMCSTGADETLHGPVLSLSLGIPIDCSTSRGPSTLHFVRGQCRAMWAALHRDLLVGLSTISMEGSPVFTLSCCQSAVYMGTETSEVWDFWLL